MQRASSMYDVQPDLAIYTRDGQSLGFVKEVRGDAFKVDAPWRGDYWLSTEDVLSVIPMDRLTVVFERDELERYKLDDGRGEREMDRDRGGFWDRRNYDSERDDDRGRDREYTGSDRDFGGNTGYDRDQPYYPGGYEGRSSGGYMGEDRQSGGYQRAERMRPFEGSGRAVGSSRREGAMGGRDEGRSMRDMGERGSSGMAQNYYRPQGGGARRYRDDEREQFSRPDDYGELKSAEDYPRGSGYQRFDSGSYWDWDGDSRPRQESSLQGSRWEYGANFAAGDRERYQRSTGASGRGPKGYSRPDQSIFEDVCQRLTADGDVDASEVEVHVENGEVTLSGSVDTRFQKRRAEDVAASIHGVKDVHNKIKATTSVAQRGDEHLEV